MTTVTRWWWVRHAPVTEHNGTIYGQMDLPCDCSDQATFQALAGMLPVGAALVRTPLQRTAQTAEAIAVQGLDFSESLIEPDFKEQSFGDWQGVSYEDFDKIRDGIAHRYWLAPAYERAPNGESFTDLIARTVPAITKLTASHAGRDIIAVTHGGTIRAAISFALGLDPERVLAFSIDNCSVTRLDHIDHEGQHHWRVGFINWLPRSKGDQS
ncbi:histidine phosphatase family protein [Aestuariispira insulae]|uniref:Broad specificity phosphatase PhoE n=1 Tax=Aestuariispira insulae TaxID=1461337 RepID=A0A3D9HFC0_9PROT|nr:histidine phosphatase family protein [Aestuariispira insulae]RED47666.1 broad specificity phosphatase PhoE [Aestuariispira insulae]